MSIDLVMRAVDYTSTEVQLRSLLGGLLSADWRQALIARGFGWHFDVGTGVTPVLGGGAGTVFDQDQPEFAASCPAGYTMIPLRVEVNAMPGLSTTDSHVTDIILSADVAAAGAGLNSTNGTMETPVNMRSNIASGCPLTVCSALTMNITNPTLGADLSRVSILTDFQGTPATVNLNQAKLIYEPACPPFLVGPCCLYGYWCGSIATNGYASVELLVISSSLLGLS